MKKWLVGGAIVAYFTTCLLFPIVSAVTMGALSSVRLPTL